MDFKHEIFGLKDQADKNHVDENVSYYGTFFIPNLFDTSFYSFFKPYGHCCTQCLKQAFDQKHPKYM